MTKIYLDDSVNLLVRTLFGDWPKENLAQVYSGRYVGKGEFCGRYYELDRRDRRFGNLFYKLKPIGLYALSGNSPLKGNVVSTHNYLRVVEKFIYSKILTTGYWELIFSIHLSEPLISFIKEFQPEIIYCQGYSIGITHLTLAIAQQFRVPICYFPVDDWHSTLYSHSIVHRKVEYLATEIAKKASLRFALGPKMAEVLSGRYKTQFEYIFHADDLTRFPTSNYLNFDETHTIIIGYTGSLYLGRTKPLLDLVRATKLLMRPIKIKIFCSEIPVDTPKELINSSNVEFLPLPDHDFLPFTLADCDILFIPESFDPVYQTATSLSLSTKAHLYMMSRRPILVYAPPSSGIVDYARRFKWGIIVDQESEDLLVKALKDAIFPDIAEKSIEQGYEVAKLNHDIHNLRKIILNRVQKCVNSSIR